jgi:hypothetical protein
VELLHLSTYIKQNTSGLHGWSGHISGEDVKIQRLMIFKIKNFDWFTCLIPYKLSQHETDRKTGIIPFAAIVSETRLTFLGTQEGFLTDKQEILGRADRLLSFHTTRTV